MPFTFVSPAIATSAVKMKWREQYVTSGLNKKMGGITPAGIYRGLNLSTSGSNNTVTVIPDAAYLDHLAVYETSTGFSLTYRDATNTTYSLDLSDASLLSTTVIIAILISYSEGADTAATFIAYTLTEFNALSASARGELVVLGTVVNPAGGNVISASSITADRRTFAWKNMPIQAVAWAPLLKNGGFERSPVQIPFATANETLVEGWRSNVSGQLIFITLDNSAAETGTRAIGARIGAAATVTGDIRQYVGVSVTAGQRLRVKFSKQVLTAASGGTGSVIIGFTEDNGSTPITASVAFAINGTDGAYQHIDSYVTVPTNAITLNYVAIALTSAVYASSASPAVRFDNVQVFLEPTSVESEYPYNDSRLREMYAASLTLQDPTENAFDNIAAVLRFDKATPNTDEGQVQVLRKDGQATSAANYPALSHPGRILNLGSSLIGTEADALKPRIQAQMSVASNTQFTLLWESVPAGIPGVRIYAGDVNSSSLVHNGWLLTTNAKFDGTNWSKDNNALVATAIYISCTDEWFQMLNVATSVTSWTNGQWASTFYSSAITSGFGGTGATQLNSSTVFLGSGIVTHDTTPIIALEIPPQFKGNVVSFSEGDVVSPDIVDPHGQVYKYGQWFREDFDGLGTAIDMVKDDRTGTGSLAFDGSVVTVTSGASNLNMTALRTYTSAQWVFVSGRNQGFRIRARITDITNSIIVLGFWEVGAGNCDTSTNGFQINDGVVSVHWTDNTATHSTSTGFTANASTFYWFSWYWDEDTGVIVYNISTDITSGYNSGTYGELSHDTYNSGSCFIIAAAKTTTSSAAAVEIDLVTAWSPTRNP